MWTKGRGHLKISKDRTGNQTWDYFFWLNASVFSIVYNENRVGRGVTELVLNDTFSFFCRLPSLKSKIMTYAVTLDLTRDYIEATLTTCVINKCMSIIIKNTPSVKTKDRLVSAEMGHRQAIHIKIHQ
jgi:hypothetical protein